MDDHNMPSGDGESDSPGTAPSSAPASPLRIRAHWRGLTGAGLVALGSILIVVLLAARSSPAAPSTTRGQEHSDVIVRVNDEVVGRGSVIAERIGTPRLCYVNGVMRMPRESEIELSGPPCPQASVNLKGVNPVELPHWTQWTKFGFSDMITIRGRWTGDAVDVRGVGPYERPPLDARHGRACDPAAPPVGRQPTSELEYESALSGLAAALRAKPDLYTGYWVTTVPGTADDAGQRIIVVGTFGDTKTARDDLAREFHYAICAATVEFTEAELEQVKAEIAQAHPSWVLNVHLDVNRVSVVVPILDQATMDILARYRSVVPDPLVSKVDR